MPENTEPASLYSLIEECSRLVDVTCSREIVLPILAAYRDTLGQAVIAFRVATGESNSGDFDCRFTMLPKDLDPYAVAKDNGLIGKTDHPVGSLLGELHREFPIESTGIDFGVIGGFKKTWSFFPIDGLQPLSELVGLPSMPGSVAGNLDLFTRYGLADRVSLIGIDYPNRSANLYFGAAPTEVFEPSGIRSILREAGLAEPSERLLALGARAFGIYATMKWESRKVERITIAAMTSDPMTLPVRIEPRIEHFVRNSPYRTDDCQFVYAITSSPDGEYHKIQSYYKWQSRVKNILLVSNNV